MLRRVTKACLIFLLTGCAGGQSPQESSYAGHEAYELPPEAESLGAEADDADASQNQAPRALNKAGVSLVPTTSIFLSGTTFVGEPLPLMVLVQSDNPEICRHLQDGTMPKNSAMFAAVILQWGQGPFAVGTPYRGQAHLGREQAPYVQGHFRALDATCEITPAGENGVGLDLSYGALVLREYTENEHAVADFKFRAEADGEAVEGRINATFCDAPKFFENPEVFLLPVDESQCK